MDSTHVPPKPVLVLYCGGTFGMLDRGIGLEARASIESAIHELLSGSGRGGTPWRYVALPRVIDSADASFAHALSIARAVRSVAGEIRGAVIVHGTDTLTYAASVSAFALADLAFPIVFTGAQRPLGSPASDAGANFNAAFTEALDGPAGVRIAFGGVALPGVRAIKASTNATAAFVAPRELAPGAHLPDWYRERLGRLSRGGDASTSETVPRIGMLRVFPGLDPELLRVAGSLYPDGIVLECYGAGTAPMSTPGLAATIGEIVAAGTPVVAITQCHRGTVDLRRYALGAALHQAGVWSGLDLTPDAAMAKLAMICALDVTGSDRDTLFSTNLVGELHATPHATLHTTEEPPTPQ